MAVHVSQNLVSWACMHSIILEPSVKINNSLTGLYFHLLSSHLSNLVITISRYPYHTVTIWTKWELKYYATQWQRNNLNLRGAQVQL